MRPDMGKVVCEHPRCGGGYKQPKGYYKKLNHIPADEHPKRESIRKKWLSGYSGKDFTDVLGPLRGYVHSVIGKHFDKVYSEIKKALPGDNMSVRHVIGHLWQFLERKVIIVDGKPCHSEMNYRYRRVDGFEYVPIEYSNFGPIAYVDPRDGVIKRAPKRPTPPREKRPKTRHWDGDKLYHKIDGLWYAIEYKPYTITKIPNSYGRYGRYSGGESLVALELPGIDVVLRESVGLLNTYNLTQTHGRSGIYAAKKTQISSREIKRLGLRD
jgi:hypothetical protein